MLDDGVWKGRIIDQHIHLDIKNRFLSAIDEFCNSGGTDINLVHKPDFNNLPRSIKEYQVAYNSTLEMAEIVRSKYDIGVNAILGPHPVAWEKQLKSLGIEQSTNLHIEAVELAIDHIKEKDAVCLGEVGRPHYPVDENTWRLANKLLLKVMKRAAADKISIQLHVENNGIETYSDLSKMCKISGLPKERAIRHFAPSDLRFSFTHGISSTINVGKGSIAKIIETISKSDSYWGMETDYLDDPVRPGAVLGPRTVPKRTQELTRELWKSDYSDNEINKILQDIHINWPNKLYS